jgi:hypothetical protein
MSAGWRGRGVRSLGALAAVAAVVLLGACFRKGKGVQPAQAPVVVVVSNRGYFDVVVYVLPSASGDAMRLGMVTGFSRAALSVRPTQLQPGGTLAVRLHPFGTPFVWDTPGITVSPGDHVALDVYTDSDGNPNRSVLYPLPPGDTSGRVAGGTAPGR